jgi:hypothetical protein
MLIMLLFRSRKENLERAREHEAAGNSRAAYECYQKAVDITPKIASDLIQVQMQIPCIAISWLPSYLVTTYLKQFLPECERLFGYASCNAGTEARKG